MHCWFSTGGELARRLRGPCGLRRGCRDLAGGPPTDRRSDRIVRRLMFVIMRLYVTFWYICWKFQDRLITSQIVKIALLPFFPRPEVPPSWISKWPPKWPFLSYILETTADSSMIPTSTPRFLVMTSQMALFKIRSNVRHIGFQDGPPVLTYFGP